MGKLNIKKSNLLLDAPELCKEWNYNKNKLSPDNFYKSSHIKVWWICEHKHEWEAAIHARFFIKNNCPYCANKIACIDNCLETHYVELSKEWNYSKNELTPGQVLPNTKKKVWWKCINGHEWRAWISDRVNGTKCTQCSYGYIVRDRKDIYNEDNTKKYCKICEKLFDLEEFRLRGNNQKGYWENNVCKNCDVKLVKDYRLTDNGIAASIVTRVKYISKKESIPFDLDKNWVLNKLNSIEWKCELTGLPMIRKRDNLQHSNTGFQWNAISIDKIKPELGYGKSNVRFILNQINCFKQDGNYDRLYFLAETLLKNRKI